MTNLTEHFTLEELTYSDTAKKYNIKNTPTEVHLKTLKHTCEYFLEPLRTLLNDNYKTYSNKTVKQAVIKITSGYRSAELNKKIGGATKSQHQDGQAADFDVILVFTDGSKFKLPYRETYNFIKKQVKNNKISVDQLICESSNGTYWVHASYKAGGASVNRKQFLIYSNGVYTTDK